MIGSSAHEASAAQGSHVPLYKSLATVPHTAGRLRRTSARLHLPGRDQRAYQETPYSASGSSDLSNGTHCAAYALREVRRSAGDELLRWPVVVYESTRTFYDRNGVKVFTSPPYNPTTNSRAKRYVAELKRLSSSIPRPLAQPDQPVVFPAVRHPPLRNGCHSHPGNVSPLAAFSAACHFGCVLET